VALADGEGKRVAVKYYGTDPEMTTVAQQMAFERNIFGKGLRSSTFQLNLSALYGTGGARRGCVARVMGVVRVFRVCRVFSCHRHGSS